MYTSHGHHINGTPLEPWTKDMKRARCGGPNICKVCKSEQDQILKPGNSKLLITPKPEDDSITGPTYLYN